MKKAMLLWIAFLSMLWTQDHALIVTIGEYRLLSPIKGTKQDFEVYNSIMKRWNVSDVTVLKDREATAANILEALRNVASKIKMGDRFYFFLSGHGSSLYDPLYSIKFQQAGLTEWLRDSGAVLPYDFDPKETGKRLIIGKRDLRPILEEIDDRIEYGIAIFDVCYGEQSIRAENSVQRNQAAAILTSSPGYPYQHLVYIASSFTEAQSGIFSPVLDACLQKDLEIGKLRECIDRKMRKTPQIPVVLSFEKADFN